MAKINLVLSEKMFECSKKTYIKWDSDVAPHIAVSGLTGSGKTYLVKLILARISKCILDSQITICDFKGGSDYAFLDENVLHRFYQFDKVLNGFEQFYDSFLQRQLKKDTNSFRLLMFDEFACFLQYLDKKESEEIRRKMSLLLMMSRSFNYHILISQQRLDADYFSRSRDNLNTIITLGNISKEVKEMLYSSYKDEIFPDRSRGTGYMLTNGTDFQKIIVPQIRDMDLVNKYIKQAVER